MSYPFLLIFALSPSIIWLLYFLRKDVHPESNRMVLKIFFLGMLAAIPAALIELGFFQITSKLNLSFLLISLLNTFLGVAFIEEALKYLVIRSKVLDSPEFDEPIDAMLYMIIAALGFAALENLLIFFSPNTFFMNWGETFTLAGFRFISATFFHALVSGAMGYFIARGFFEKKGGGWTVSLIQGLLLAVVLHGLYNFSIGSLDLLTQGSPGMMELGKYLKVFIPVIIVAGLAIFVSIGFKKLRNITKLNL